MAGGLSLFWTGDIDVRVMGKDDHHIYCRVYEDEGCSWRLTRVYEWSENAQKYRT